MAAGQEMTSVIEEGDLFFFYRPRVETEEVRGRGDVQRFYMVLAAERPRRRYRLFVVGRKKLPEVTAGQHPAGRSWALCLRVSHEAEDIRRELKAVEYPTATRGDRFVPSATPVGEGKYQLLRHGNHTEIAYVLELPKEPGPAQQEFEIEKEASYIAVVKNPAVSTPGAPSPEPPVYPQELLDLFGERRWIDVQDPALLDYERAQLLLLGARAANIEEELGVAIDEEDETLRTADICRDLRTRCDRERVKPLITGEFPEEEESRASAEALRDVERRESPSS